MEISIVFDDVLVEQLSIKYYALIRRANMCLRKRRKGGRKKEGGKEGTIEEKERIGRKERN